MPKFTAKHIIIEGRTEVLPFTSNQTVRSKIIPRTGLDRQLHGNSIRVQFNNARDQFLAQSDEDNFIYLVFKSPLDFLLDLDKLDKNQCRLASYKICKTQIDGTSHLFYEATVFLNRRAISVFLRKVEEYVNNDTPINYNPDGSMKSGGNPKNQSLIANIDEIRAATLESFWQEPELPFPKDDVNVWWEIWINKENENPIRSISERLIIAGVQISDKYIEFPEHFVYFMKGTVTQLSSSLLYTDMLAEIRQPRETADYFTNLEILEQNEWISDLVSRTDHVVRECKVSVCLLDYGVNRANPLLKNLIPARHLDAIQPTWNKSDTHGQGHGTAMAGLILYGDLTEVISSNVRVQIFHHFESVKLLELNQPHKPNAYGAVTLEAMERAEVLNPNFKRIFCMAVTSVANDHKGRPSSWSSAIDQIIYGNVGNLNSNSLFFVSTGNLPLEERKLYPLANLHSSIQDPAQSFNSITVGAYTLKDTLSQADYPNSELLAERGGMAPCNLTSCDWDNDWCRKPDIVFEGGNEALQNDDSIYPESLLLLSSAKGGIGRSWLTSFCDTSAATALASRFGAELYCYYPNLLPETIRALIIHSADWTPSMLRNRTIDQLNFNDKRAVFSQFGYGVPNMERARYSANDNLSLIIERTIRPFKFENGRIKTDEFHLFDLPWPKEALQDLFAVNVKFKITLSYFIEPNPGNKRYEKSASYCSHGLRFKMIDANETEYRFKQRISREMRNDELPYQREGGEQWILGEKLRNKGSIHKDIWEGTASDLATRNKVAIYPIGGWWKANKRHNRFQYSVRYSLIMTIETPSSEDTDIYTPVMNMLNIPVDIEN